MRYYLFLFCLTLAGCSKPDPKVIELGFLLRDYAQINYDTWTSGTSSFLPGHQWDSPREVIESITKSPQVYQITGEIVRLRMLEGSGARDVYGIPVIWNDTPHAIPGASQPSVIIIFKLQPEIKGWAWRRYSYEWIAKIKAEMKEERSKTLRTTITATDRAAPAPR